MAKKTCKIGDLTDGKKEIIAKLLEEYDIESAKNIQYVLANLLGNTIKGMMKAERPNGRPWIIISDMKRATNVRNGYKIKKIKSKYDEFNIDVPQGPASSFDVNAGI